MDKSFVFSSTVFWSINKSSFKPSMSVTISEFDDRCWGQFGELSSSIDVPPLRWQLLASSDSDGCIVCSVETKGSGACKSVEVPGFFRTNSTSLSFRPGPSRPWKFRVCCFLLYQLIITLPLELLNCFVLPPGVSHFPCSFKTLTTKFLRESKSFNHTNLSPLRRRWYVCKKKIISYHTTSWSNTRIGV